MSEAGVGVAPWFVSKDGKSLDAQSTQSYLDELAQRLAGLEQELRGDAGSLNRLMASGSSFTDASIGANSVVNVGPAVPFVARNSVVRIQVAYTAMTGGEAVVAFIGTNVQLTPGGGKNVSGAEVNFTDTRPLLLGGVVEFGGLVRGTRYSAQATMSLANNPVTARCRSMVIVSVFG